MEEFKTLFVLKENISWDTFLFSLMFFLIILGIFIVYINDKSKNEKGLLSTISIFIVLLGFAFMLTSIAYNGVLAQKKLWASYQKGAYVVTTGKVAEYKVGYKYKHRYEYFILNGIKFYSVYASPNPTDFDDKIFYQNKEILEHNLTIRISYMEHIEGMINPAIVRFEVLKKNN